MTVQNVYEQVKQLSPSERVELFEALADLIGPSDEDNAELTPAQEADLDERIAEIRSGKAKLSPGDDVFERLRRRP